MAADEAADAQAVFNMVAKHMQQARANSEESIRIKHLREAKHLILTKNTDLIDNFWNEMLQLRHEKSAGLTVFCLQWIRDACQKDPLLLSEAVPIIVQLMDHPSVIIQKESLLAATYIYRNTFPYLFSSKTSEADGKGVFAQVDLLKEQIRTAIVEDFEQRHVGFRMVSYKFIEILVICQSPRDEGLLVADDDPVSSADIPDRSKLLSRQTMEEEGSAFFRLLEEKLTSTDLHIKYEDRLALCGCVMNLIRHRCSFLPRVLSLVEYVHANIPQDFSELQVNSIRKFLKASLLSVLRQTRSQDAKLLKRIASLLPTLGTSPNEITRARPSLPQVLERMKREADSEPVSSGKRHKTSDVRDDLQGLATELNAAVIGSRLTPANVVELVMTNMRKLGSVMPVTFNATYTPIGTGPIEGIIEHLARLIGGQMYHAGVGPGQEEVERRRQEELSVKQQMEADAVEGDDEEDQPQAISSVLRKPVQVRQDEQEENDDDMADEAESALVIAETPQESREAFKPVEKALRVTEVTAEIPVDDRENAILTIVNELISNDVNILNAAGEFMLHKCLIRFAVKVGKASLRDRLMKYILEDIGTRSELAFRWIYEEYAAARELKRDRADIRHNMDNYNDCLTKLVQGFIDHPEYREGLVSALYMEVPVITDQAISLLNYYCTERSLHGAMRLIFKLVSSRPAPHRFLTGALNMTLHMRKDIQHQAVQTCIKIYETCPDLRLHIKAHAVHTMKYLCEPIRPPTEFFERHGKVGTLDMDWTEDLQRLCTTLFIGLLADEPTLLPVLGQIYVDISNDAKKIVFKVIEQPMKAVQMNDIHVLEFVKSPPKGSESLVLRIIHLLTESHPPSPELISSIRGLYNDRITDVRFLIPILNGLTKDEIFAALPKLITLNPVVVQEVFSRLLGTGKHKLDSSQRRPSVTPAEVLIELHKIEISKTDAKKLIKATGICLEEKDLYSAETMINILQDLVELEPLPFLLMRTVLQTLQLHPRSLPFVIKILHRLVVREVWNYTLLWEGFVKCCEKTAPQSYAVLLQLPGKILQTVLRNNPGLKQPLEAYLFSLPANQKAQLQSQVVCLVETGQLEDTRPVIAVDEKENSEFALRAESPNQNGDKLSVEDTSSDDALRDKETTGGSGAATEEGVVVVDDTDDVVIVEPETEENKSPEL